MVNLKKNDVASEAPVIAGEIASCRDYNQIALLFCFCAKYHLARVELVTLLALSSHFSCKTFNVYDLSFSLLSSLFDAKDAKDAKDVAAAVAARRMQNTF